MDLDSKIIEGKEPLNCFDINTAKQFIGKKGYFSDYLSLYAKLNETEEDVLKYLDEHHDEAFITSRSKWEFFLPAEWVKPKEKKFRPFTGIEFAEKFDLKLGGIIRLRNIITQYSYKTIFTGYRWHDDDFEVFLNGGWMSLNTLFNTYEYDEDNEWKKFGVEE